MSTSVSSFKSFSIACMALCIALLSYSQINAFNPIKEAKAISDNPEYIHTMYIGMSKSDLYQNFTNVTGWEISNESNFFAIQREQPDYNLTQTSFATFDNTNHVRTITSRFNAKNKENAIQIYDSMYNTLGNHYGSPKDSMNKLDIYRSAKWINGSHTYYLSILPIYNRNHTIKYYTIDLNVDTLNYLYM